MIKPDKTLVLIKDSTLQLADLSRKYPLETLIRNVQERIYQEILEQLPSIYGAPEKNSEEDIGKG